MNFPVETKPVFWGAMGGAIAVAVVGFNWGGWVTGSKAEADAKRRVDEAVVVALAPVCLENFEKGANVAASRAELKKTDNWSQSEFVEKGGWAKVPGKNSPERVSAVARACADLIIGA
jgi:coenzyme F420-reducing hydrogenase beta subunit